MVTEPCEKSALRSVEGVHGGERLHADLFVFDFDAELLLESQNELQGVDRVETEPLSEERGRIVDRLRVDFELQAAHDQVLDARPEVFLGHSDSFGGGLYGERRLSQAIPPSTRQICAVM